MIKWIENEVSFEERLRAILVLQKLYDYVMLLALKRQLELT